MRNGVVTVFRITPGNDDLACLGTVPAWIHREEILRNDQSGVYQGDRFDIRIEKAYMDDIRTGDFVFIGRAESSCVHISECVRISSVVDNNFGSTPHWHLAAEYRYR